MQIGILELELIIEGSSSLKDKRMVLRRLKDKIRNRFNVSLAEVSEQEKWQRATLVAASVGTDKRYVNSVLSKIATLIMDSPDVELSAQRMEIL